ncbi:MAG: STAS domain-containing protein [Magnetospirillum sp.]|nr:STAS domain-containing protein [Magnetospirillum sp.]
MERQAHDGTIAIHLPSVLDLPAAMDLHDALLDALADNDGDVVVEGAAVERMSTAAVQVLLAAAAGFKAAGRHFAVAAPSDRIVDAFRQLGLAAQLGSFS